jgi:lactoylglutathione lyase
MNMTAPLEVALVVSDLARMRQFYEKALGLAFVSEIVVGPEKSAEAAMSDVGYTVVRLQTPYGERIKLVAPNRKPAPRQDLSGRMLDHQSTIYLTFIVDDIAKVVEQVRAEGATLLNAQPVTEVRDGVFLAFLRDPEGHIIEIVQYRDVTAYRSDLVAK